MVLVTFKVGVAFGQAPDISYPSPQNYVVNTPISTLKPANKGGVVPAINYGQTSTLAGNQNVGSVNGKGNAASFNNPNDVTVDVSGNVYVADQRNNLIRKIAPDGTVITLAGDGTPGLKNASGVAAEFNQPTGIAIDGSGNLYIADSQNHVIRKISITGNVTTYAGTGLAGSVDGATLTASFDTPYGLALDGSGNLYVTDWDNKVREVSAAGIVSTIAGTGGLGANNGPGSQSTFDEPCGITLDAPGNIYVADRNNALIRKIIPAGIVSTFAGLYTLYGPNSGGINGPLSVATFYYPVGIKFDIAGNLYVSDAQNNQVRVINTSGFVTPVSGSGAGAYNDAPGSQAEFNNPSGIAIDGQGNLYVADGGNQDIRKIAITGYSIFPYLPYGLLFDQTTGYISGNPKTSSAAQDYIINAYNSSGSSSDSVNIRIIYVQTINFPPIPIKLDTDPDFSANVTSSDGTIPNIYSSDPNVATITGNGLIHIVSIGTCTIYTYQYGQAIGTATMISQTLTVVPGGGSVVPNPTVTVTPQKGPINIQLDGTGNYKLQLKDVANVTCSDSTPPNISITPSSFSCATLGAQNVTVTASIATYSASAVSFNVPSSLALDAAGNLYITDTFNGEIRKITPSGVVSTFANVGYRPSGIAIDASGNLYVTDAYNNCIYKITPSGVVTLFAGSGNEGNPGSIDGLGTAATFNAPYGITIDGSGNLYVTEEGGNIVRKITPAGLVSTIAGQYALGYADGQGSAADFFGPSGITVDKAGNLFVCDEGNNRIRKITPGGYVSTYAGNGSGSGDGPASSAGFNNPRSIVIDASGNLYVGEYSGDVIRKISTAGIVTTVAGNGRIGPTLDGAGTAATFFAPSGLAIDPSGTFFIADEDENLIRKMSASYYVTTYAGSGSTGDQNGNIVNGNVISSTAQIPVTVQSSLAITSTYTDVIIHANSACPATLPDYTKTATATDNCSNNIKFTQSPMAGTVLSPDAAVTVTITATDTLNSTTSVSFKVTADNNVPAPSLSISGPAVACAGTALTFTAVPVNVTPSTYQWQVNGSNAGGNSPSFITSALNNNDVVTCNISTGQSCLTPVTSNPLSITINPIITPVVNVQADNLAPCAGMPVTFTATLNSGIVNPGYQWMVNGVNTGTNSATFVTTTLIKTDIVQCTVTNNSSCPTNGTSNQVSGIDQIPYTTPAITIQSTAINLVCSGTLITFTATPTNGDANPAYQWQVNGANAGTNTPTFASSSLADGDVISCLLTNNGGQCITASQATSNSIKVSVIPPSNLVPTVTITPDGYGACVGMSLTYTATTTNAGSTPTYQWQVNGQDAGTNAATFTSSALNTGDKIICIITSSIACSVATATSNTASLTADAYTTNSVSISSTAVNNIISPNQQVTFTATTAYTTSGTTTVAYQWQVNNVNAGTDNAVFTTNSLKNDDVVTCIITTTGKCIALPVVSSNPIEILVITPVIIVNTFTPNGDGVNDTWDIPSLAAYTGCTINIFNRYGSLVYNSIGYPKPWDGTYNGKPLPSATYYYIIDLKDGKKPLSGPITILR